MYIYIYIYHNISHIFMYMYIFRYAYMHICIYAYMHICIYVYMYICIYVYMYIRLYVYMCICRCTCRCRCICKCICIPIYHDMMVNSHIAILLYIINWCRDSNVPRQLHVYRRVLPQKSQTEFGWNVPSGKHTKTMENQRFEWVNQLFLWPFSVANC